MKLFGIFSFLSIVVTTAAFACPENQHQECALPRPWGGCAQNICVPDINIPKPEDVLCEPVGIAGAAAYTGAAEGQRNHHSGGVPLHPRFKWALRGQFGSLVDEVNIHYNARMLDSVKVGNRTLNYPSDGQTFGRDIYLNMSEAEATLSLIAHEMEHVHQWASRGSKLESFGRDYFNNWCKAGFNYSSNSMERDAQAVGDKFPSARLSGLPDPVLTLTDMHGGCDGGNMQSNECHAAIHRYVMQQGVGSAGVSQEVGDNAAGILAVRAPFYGDFSMAELVSQHGGCQYPFAQSNNCVAAVHRSCGQRGYSVGLTQEIGSTGYGVACFNADWYGDVSMAELKSLHGGCEYPEARSNNCVAAIHRACLNRGFAGGLAQEIGNQAYGIACFNGSWYGNARIRP